MTRYLARKSPKFVSLLGMAVMIFFAWLCSLNRKMFPWRTVVRGLWLQLFFAVFILKTPIGDGRGHPDLSEKKFPIIHGLRYIERARTDEQKDQNPNLRPSAAELRSVRLAVPSQLFALNGGR